MYCSRLEVAGSGTEAGSGQNAGGSPTGQATHPSLQWQSRASVHRSGVQGCQWTKGLLWLSLPWCYSDTRKSICGVSLPAACYCLFVAVEPPPAPAVVGERGSFHYAWRRRQIRQCWPAACALALAGPSSPYSAYGLTR